MADIEMTPITRKEFYLAGITGMDVQAPSPVTRLESYLNDILNGTVSQLTPLNRVECYLAKISGADVTIPVPVTRLEFYLAAIAGMDIDVPDPVTREEHWLWQWANAGPGGVVETVTGTLPLTLANALSHAIVSLTRYGLCTQDGIPTPYAPLDIMCNNGTLRMVDDELPSGYKRITGIKFDGDFWYDTGEALTGDDDVTMTLANTATGGQNVFGSYNGTSDGAKNFSLYIYGGGSSSNSYFRYGGQLLRPKFGSNERTITFGKSGTSGFTTDVTTTPETFTTVATAYIGMLPNSSSPAYTGSIIGSILVGTRLKWIPCERESDGVVGYYEAVNGAFLEPTGTGVPVAGSYDTSHFNRLAVVGTPEVLTVSGANLLNPATNITGHYIKANGSIATGSDAQYTDLIPVTAGETYLWSLISNRAGGGTNRLHGYNSAGNWVQQIAFNSTGLGIGMPFALTAVILNGISYVRLSYGIDDTEVMFCHVDSSSRISAEGYYLGSQGSNTATTNRTPIQSPYTTTSAYKGPAIVFSVLPGKIYVAKADAVTNYTNILYSCYNNIEDINTSSKAVSKGNGVTFAAPNGANYAVVVYINNASGKTFTFDEPYVSEMDADYQPYVAPQAASVPSLFALDNRKDEADIISGAVTRQIGIKVLDGTENWVENPSLNYFVVYGYLDSYTPTPTRAPQNFMPLSTHFSRKSGAIRPRLDTTGTDLVLYYSEEFSDLATWKAWLAAQYAAGTPVIIVYKLNGTEVTEQVPAQHLVTNEGTNIVDSVANVSPLEAKVKYMTASAQDVLSTLLGMRVTPKDISTQDAEDMINIITGEENK